MYWLSIAVAFLAALALIIGVFHLYFRAMERNFAKRGKVSDLKPYQKKLPLLETVRYDGLGVGLLGNIGIIVALLTIWAAFEWKIYDPIETGKDSPITRAKTFQPQEEMHDVMVTEHELPPPQPIQQPEIKEVDDREKIEELDVVLETELREELEIEEQYTGPTSEHGIGNPDDFRGLDVGIGKPGTAIEEEEKREEVFIVAEEDARFPGGNAAFLHFLKENLQYPKEAKRMGYQGTVHVQFVIEKNGELTDVVSLREVGYGLDEEAIRVVELSPPWTPALQRGRPVRLKKIVPIKFRLREV